jgi:DNA-binding HxlR family transcriptional regulator
MRTLRIIGDVWTLAIIRDLEHSGLRFGELHRTIVGINPVTLTNRLKRLEQIAVVNRETETKDKQSVVYSLTARGKKLLPIIHAISKASSDLK